MSGTLFDSYSFFDGIEMEPVTQVNWSNYWRGVIPDGVVAEVEDEMRPYANSTGMYVYVSKGACIVDNHRGVNSTLKTLAVTTADEVYDRIDLLVARVVYGNENESYMELDIKTGTPALDPVAPTLTQTTGGTYEIALAEIYVAAEVVTLTAETVTDMRNVFTAASQSVSFENDDSVPLEKGMLVVLSRDKAGAVKRCQLDHEPIGIVKSDFIGIGSKGQIATISGEIAEIACDSGAVKLGDGLVPSSTAGIAKAGAGYGGGIALEAKADGAVGNVKALLAIMSRIPTQNGWYLPDGIEENNVIAAFRFVGRDSEADALVSVHEGTSYSLTKSDNTVTWNNATGFYFPAVKGIGLYNSALADLISSFNAGGFGFSGASTSASNLICGGITPSQSKCLYIRGTRGTTYLNGPSMNNANSNSCYYSPTKYANGVLTCNWSSNELYANGELLATSSSSTYTNWGALFGQVGMSEDRSFTPFYMTAVVIYNTALTAAQHLKLAQNIQGLGGLS